MAESREEWRVRWKRPHWATEQCLVVPDKGFADNYFDEVRSYADAPIEYLLIEKRTITTTDWERADG